MGKRFSFLIVGCALLIGCDEQPQAAKATVSHPVYVRKKMPPFGVEFTQPIGWTEVPPTAVGRIAEWTRGKAGVLAVDAIRDSRAGDIIAAELSREWGGKIDDTALPVDGLRGLRIRTPYVEEKPYNPTDAVVVGAYGRHYVVLALDPDGKDCAKDVEELVRSFKWIDVEHPTKHLQFHDKPLPMFDGLVSVHYPRIMCQQPTEDKRKELPGVALAIMDFSSNYLDLVVSFQLLDAGTTKRARELPERVLEMATTQLKPREPFVLQPRAGKPNLLFSQVVDLEAPDGRPWQQVKGRFGYTMVSEYQALLVNVRVAPRIFDHIPAYLDVTEKMIDSITVHPKALAMLAP